MNAGNLRRVVMGLRSSAVLEKAAPRADSELLRRYADSGDETAFELLVWRHAGMVVRVARAVVRDHHAAEDVTQATFLALAKPGPASTGSFMKCSGFGSSAAKIASPSASKVRALPCADRSALTMAARS